MDSSTATALLSTSQTKVERFCEIGVVGLGRMGEAFATNLIADGFKLKVFDRDKKRCDRMSSRGADALRALSGLARTEIVLTSLPDDEALSDVVERSGGLLETLAQGATHVSMSTVSPSVARRLSRQHAGRGHRFVAAPVLGNPDSARDRKLFILISGDVSSVPGVLWLLQRLGQRAFQLGQDPGAAPLMKLAANVLTASTLESMGEVLALVRKAGLDGHSAFDVLTNSLFDGTVHKSYGGRIVEERYAPAGMTLPLAIKDLRLALTEAEYASVPMPAASLVHDRLVGMVARGWAELDWSALGLLASREAGLPDKVFADSTAVLRA